MEIPARQRRVLDGAGAGVLPGHRPFVGRCVWGGKFVQPWGSFPASKWDDVPKSDATHAALSTPGLKEVPWGPGTDAAARLGLGGRRARHRRRSAGQPGNGQCVRAPHRLCRRQYRVAVPQDETGVYTVSADSMGGDLTDPTGDRYVHIDRHTGKVLVQVSFADYSPMAKFMAIGIALHQGDMGLWSAMAQRRVLPGGGVPVRQRHRHVGGSAGRPGPVAWSPRARRPMRRCGRAVRS